MTMQSLDQNRVPPPEEQFRQPGALEHGKKNWFALHQLVGYTLLAAIFLAIVAVTYYFVTVGKIPTDAPLNPLHKDLTSSFKTYQDADVSFQYPKEDLLAPETMTAGYAYFDATGKQIAAVEIPANTFPGTNFSDSFVVISKDETIKNASDCKQYSNGASEIKTMTKSQKINGQDFDSDEFSGAAAGNFYETRLFRIFHGGTCFEVSATLHTADLGNFDPGQVKAVDKNKAWNKLVQILNTIKFNDKTSTQTESTSVVATTTFTGKTTTKTFTDGKKSVSFTFPVKWIVSGSMPYLSVYDTESNSTDPVLQVDLGCVYAVDGVENPTLEKSSIKYGSNTYTETKTYVTTSGKKELVFDFIDFPMPKSYQTQYCTEGTFILSPAEPRDKLDPIIASFKFN